jgi:hypothetical protein
MLKYNIPIPNAISSLCSSAIRGKIKNMTCKNDYRLTPSLSLPFIKGVFGRGTSSGKVD